MDEFVRELRSMKQDIQDLYALQQESLQWPSYDHTEAYPSVEDDSLNN